MKPEAEMPEPIRIRGTATRRELLKVLERWDCLGRLFLCKGSEVRSGVAFRVDSCSVGGRSGLQRGRQKRSSTLWAVQAVQLSQTLCWRTFMQYRYKEKAHINLQEAKARRSLIKRLPRDKRVVPCQDSRRIWARWGRVAVLPVRST